MARARPISRRTPTKGRTPPYSAGVKAFANRLRLSTYPVEVRDGAIWLVG
jgi:hypothetical protein